MNNLTRLISAFRVLLCILCAPLLLAAQLHVAQAAPAVAQVYIVDRTDDTVVNACTAAVNDCTLRGALQNANLNPGSTIELSYGNVYQVSAGELMPTASMTIAGTGICLPPFCYATVEQTAQPTQRLFHIASGAAVTLSRLTIRKNNALNSGGGINNEGTLTLTYSNVISNSAVNGGGIQNTGALNVLFSNVAYNSSASWGGGIYSPGGPITIVNSLISNNTSAYVAGGIALEAARGTIANSTLANNVAAGDGGGILLTNNITGTVLGVLSVSDSQFISNTTGQGADGGAIFSYGIITLTNSTFITNSARDGGAIDNNSGKLFITGGQFLNNKALGTGNGGAVRSGNYLALNGALLSGNTAAGGGGAVVGDGVMYISDSTLSNNQAGSGGGALFVSGTSAQVQIKHSTLNLNSALYGGGIFNYAVVTMTHHSQISNNTGFMGGGVYNTSYGTFILDGGSVLRGNQVNGGAIGESNGAGFHNQGSAQVSSAAVITNVAANGSGAGIFNAASGILTLTNVTLSGNRAAFDGGGLGNQGSARLNNVTLANNTADADTNGSGNGGGLATTGALTVANTLVGLNIDPGNQAPDCSGTLYSLGYNLLQNTAGCTLNGTTIGNLTGVAPMLSALKPGIGGAWVHVLLGGSPALNAANPAAPGSANAACAKLDQQGLARPLGIRCDIGAYEQGSMTFVPLVRR